MKRKSNLVLYQKRVLEAEKGWEWVNEGSLGACLLND